LNAKSPAFDAGHVFDPCTIKTLAITFGWGAHDHAPRRREEDLASDDAHGRCLLLDDRRVWWPE
jgi:hypothetical protein